MVVPPSQAGSWQRCPDDTLFYSEMIVTFLGTPPSADQMTIDSTYLGKPAIHFTSDPGTAGNGYLGNQFCY